MRKRRYRKRKGSFLLDMVAGLFRFVVAGPLALRRYLMELCVVISMISITMPGALERGVMWFNEEFSIHLSAVDVKGIANFVGLWRLGGVIGAPSARLDQSSGKRRASDQVRNPFI
ncbi:hypothetical protein [Achromobacter anxifer]|uniref:hypothetical protein n=1 Tax=Achromobacter anxifer TaxID=1287737 RepID=UPI0023F7C2FE|nr:hypothetical protein [Achromobacter anxifer]MDF8364687.1 hypothetical protein [Achromobacter anxifer]